MPKPDASAGTLSPRRTDGPERDVSVSRMKHASSRELYQYWNAIRGTEAAPVRTAIEPADIRTILCDMFILEVDHRRLYPFRLAGTRLCAAYGHELKTTSFLGLWEEGDRKQINLILSAVAGEARSAVVGTQARAGTGRSISFEMVLLPLIQGDGGDSRYDRILGVLAPLDLPYWLGLDPIRTQSVASARLMWPNEDALVGARGLSLQPEVELTTANASPDRRRERFVVLEGGKTAN